MAEWHVSESESEGEGAGDGGVELGSLRIPPHRVAELLKTIEERKTLDLDCLAGAVAGLSSEGRRRERRRKHKRAKRKSEASGSAGDSKNQEEVSETASELRSTASTDTTTREGKWNNVSHFDYFHEDSTGSDLTLHKKQKKLPPGNREKKLASLDQIVADVKQQKERQQQAVGDLTTTPEITLPYHQPHHLLLPHLHPAHNSTHGLMAMSGAGLAAGAAEGGNSPETASASAPLFDFGDGSDLDSPTGGDSMKMSVLSQINRVEKLLDDEGLT